MTPTTMIIALLSVLAGYVSQAVNTGSLFGVKTLPKSWLPYLTLLGTFLAAFVASIASASTVNGAAWFAAAIAGLTSLTGTAVGVTVHQHVTAKVVAMVLFVVAVGTMDTACTPAGAAELNVVFTDVQTACVALSLASAAIPAGTPLAQVAADVKLACGLTAVAEADIEQVISQWMAGQAAAGTQPPAGSVYKAPSPRKPPHVAALLPFRAPRWSLPPRRLAA